MTHIELSNNIISKQSSYALICNTLKQNITGFSQPAHYVVSVWHLNDDHAGCWSVPHPKQLVGGN